MVSPRKSRKKSACFSSTSTSTPARARSSPSIIPAGPPPTTQQRTATASSILDVLSAAVFHQLLLSLDELLGAVDAALVEHEVAHGRFDQHREIAPGGYGNGHLANRHAENFLEGSVHLQAVEVRELLRAVVLQVHHQLQELARAHGRFAEDSADVEHADAADLEKVAQHGGATAFQRIGRNAIQLDDVVGHQSVAARDEL